MALGQFWHIRAFGQVNVMLTVEVKEAVGSHRDI